MKAGRSGAYSATIKNNSRKKREREAEMAQLKYARALQVK
jgi:hypothetical protein